MQTLRATQAREINKADITEAETLVFEGRVISQSGKQAMEPGEFYFRSTVIPITTQPRWFARLFGAKPKLSWKDIATIVMACPVCATPLMTTSGELIGRRSPLTLTYPIACPYNQDQPHSFKVVEGKIMLA